MYATEILTSEHTIIEQVLDCLEKLVERGESSRSYYWPTADQILDFLRHFADGCHHAKEEQQLFPALEQRGLSPQFGPTGVMRHEHEQGRELIAAMSECVHAGLRGDNRKTRKFAAHAKAYIELLRQHIHKENHCLFPMADRILSNDDQRLLIGAFDDVEHAPEMVGRHEHYLELANELAKQFGVRQAATKMVNFAGCCGHGTH
jgi:hemerythrin-like domain-containing protein